VNFQFSTRCWSRQTEPSLAQTELDLFGVDLLLAYSLLYGKSTKHPQQSEQLEFGRLRTVKLMMFQSTVGDIVRGRSLLADPLRQHQHHSQQQHKQNSHRLDVRERTRGPTVGADGDRVVCDSCCC